MPKADSTPLTSAEVRAMFRKVEESIAALLKRVEALESDSGSEEETEEEEEGMFR